ncbi:Armadillo-type fold [Amanita muscaria]
MPRENRKRGKKHKKNPEEVADRHEEQPPNDSEEPQDELQQPSWMHSTEPVNEFNPEAPYGYVDNDVKAYFRTVDVQIRDWQENEAVEDVSGEDRDPNEERHLFFVAALEEMSGKEKQLATDPECSVILERMAHSMDDFVRRVFVDSLAGSFEIMSKHRFASHVCQTMFTVAKETVSREARGIMPVMAEASERGELRTMSQLVLDVCQEILPSIGSLIMDPFASHVVRSLLVLLNPSLAGEEALNSSLRSKKSQKWKSKQGPMKPLFSEAKGKARQPSGPAVPLKFSQMARKFVESLRKGSSDTEIRALAADKAASPALKMLIEAETEQKMANVSGSLLDSVTMGLVSACLNDESLVAVEPSDYVNTLLRDTTSSHLLEAVISRCPDHVFRILWKTYFSAKLPRLAVHPVANFVVTKAIGRLSSTELSEACDELDGSWSKLLQSMRITVLRAFVERAGTIQSSEDDVIKAICSTFELETAEDKICVVSCILYLMPLKDLHAKTTENGGKQKITSGRGKGESSGKAELTIHGSQLVQALLRLPEPHNELIIESLNALPIHERIQLAQNPYSSRVYDALLESPTVSLKAKRKTIMGFIGHYHVLVDDRIGSRITDRCWEFADTYLKEKIAKSLFTHDQELAASYYGRFFVRNLNLQLLQRRPDEWRNLQSERKKQKEQEHQLTDHASDQSKVAVKTQSDKVVQKRKREHQGSDEIDVLFDSSIGKKIKRAALQTGPQDRTEGKESEKFDASLQGVLGAIKAAPNHESKAKEKKRPK